MTKNLRLLLALMAGMIVAMLVTMGIGTMGHRLFPLPPDLDPRDTIQLVTRMGDVPMAALFAVLMAHVLGTFAGAWTAVRLAPPKGRPVGLVVGLLMLGGAFMNLVLIPHPAWFALLDLPGIGLAAWAGLLLATRRRGPS